jgi:hypothetical protein
MEGLTYQQLLAETYEETAKNLLVHQNEYEDDEQVNDHETHDYETHEVEDQDEFNKFAPRHSLQNVVQSKPTTDSKSSLKNSLDFKNTILNIDSRFRGNIVTANPEDSTSASHFVFMSHRVLRNVASVKLTSMEFPNTFYAFSTTRGNTSFTITRSSVDYTLIIPDGNYTTTTIITAINLAITSLSGTPLSGLVASYNPDTHQILFTGLGNYTLTFPSNITNPFGNGIGYNLGFMQMSYSVGMLTILGSDAAPDLIQDPYIFVAINDWILIDHQIYGQTTFPVFAKIQLPLSKNSMIFDNNYTNSSTKEYFFQQPTNLQRFEIKLLDSYGNYLDLRNAPVSLTLELKEIYNYAAYEKMREI